MSASSGVDSSKFTGGSVSFGVAVGGAITDNLILFGTLASSTITNPTFTQNGQSVTTSNLNVDYFGLGIGLAYYVMPTNLYLAGSILACGLEATETNPNGGADTTIAQTNTGVGFEGLVGKEWWVSDNWGLGVAAEVLYGRMKANIDVNPPTWTAAAFSLLFSATFN
jgi:hypothetical protein